MTELVRRRTIVHLNVADFAASVERLSEPGVSDRPLVIAHEGAAGARVYDMSEEAYQSGVRKGMPLERARRFCRDAVILPPRPEKYEKAMSRLFREVLPYSPLVEAGETDGHLFVDVTGTSRLFGPGRDTAARMYRQIKAGLGLCPVWAVASSKLVSKVATRLVKPAGEYIVEHGREKAFLSPLPVRLLPGIEASDLFRLQDLNLFYVRQAACLTMDQLSVLFGSRAGFVYNLLRGVDNSPVLPAGCRPPKIGAACEPGFDTNDLQAAEQEVYLLAEKIGAELRMQGRAAGLLGIAVEYADGLRCFRRLSVHPPSSDDISLFEVSRRLLRKAWTRRVRLRRIRLSCIKAVQPESQMELFPGMQARAEKRSALSHAVDRVRERFGRKAVCTARTMHC